MCVETMTELTAYVNMTSHELQQKLDASIQVVHHLPSSGREFIYLGVICLCVCVCARACARARVCVRVCVCVYF